MTAPDVVEQARPQRSRRLLTFDVLVRRRGAASKALRALALILFAPFAIVAYLVVRARG